MLNPIQFQLDEIITGKRKLQIDIKDDNNIIIGSMRPLTMEHIGNKIIIDALTDWRNQNMENFLTQFLATPERTCDWMRNILFQTKGQMLFLVYSEENLIGHFGFKNLTAESVLLDNAIRGDRNGHPKLFVQAGRSLIRWLKETAKIRTVYGEVMTNNVASIMMNRQIGFGGWKRYPLLKRIDGDKIFWEVGIENAISSDRKYCLKLIIE